MVFALGQHAAGVGEAHSGVPYQLLFVRDQGVGSQLNRVLDTVHFTSLPFPLKFDSPDRLTAIVKFASLLPRSQLSFTSLHF